MRCKFCGGNSRESTDRTQCLRTTVYFHTSSPNIRSSLAFLKTAKSDLALMLGQSIMQAPVANSLNPVGQNGNIQVR